MSVTELTADNFDEKTTEGTWVLDFWASWCGPCKQMKPIFEEISDEVDDVNFGSVNIEEQQDLASKHGVRSIPTFVVMKDGEVEAQQMGAMSKSNFRDWIESEAQA